MSLLPLNAKVRDQQFADIYDNRSKVDYSDIAPDPLTCHSSILQHIALAKGANINNMLESEARVYLSTFTKKTIGTAGAVSDAINVCFDNGKLVEWFDDDKLKKGMFNISVTLKNDLNLVYGERLFSLSKRLINESKNVRSKLNAFDIKINIAGAIGFEKSVVTDIALANELKMQELKRDVNISSNSTTTVALHNEIDGYAALGNIVNQYVCVSSVALSNSNNIDNDFKCDIETKCGGVFDVKLQNNPNYKSKVGVDMKITGGVVWAF